MFVVMSFYGRVSEVPVVCVMMSLNDVHCLTFLLFFLLAASKMLVQFLDDFR